MGKPKMTQKRTSGMIVLKFAFLAKLTIYLTYTMGINAISYRRYPTMKGTFSSQKMNLENYCPKP